MSPRSGDMPRYSARLHRWFSWYLRRYFARNFDAVRVSRSGSTPQALEGPLIVYSNHPSWWDPIHCFLLARHELPGRRPFGPFEAEALKKYRFFEKLGAFPVEPGCARGAARFVRTSLAVLEDPRASLWITAEGRFSDPRERPRLEPGLAHVARRLGHGHAVPLALEYPFWNERRPEALSRFGEPISLDSAASPGAPRSDAEWTELFERRLAETMDSLAAAARTRDPARFHTLVSGRKGVSPVYDGWRRLRAGLSGRGFSAAHGTGE